MAKLMRIGIAGCGAIGSSLAQRINSDFRAKAMLCGFYDIDPQKAYKLANKFNNEKLAFLSLDSLVAKSDLIIESSKAGSSFEIAKKSLLGSCSVMVMSVGGIIERYEELKVLAGENKAQVFIPSGAICGIDGLKAAFCGKIKKVTLTTRKPARAFLGVPYVLKRKINLEGLKKDSVIFEGDASTAIRLFPQNINVASTLSIAGIGARDTIVRIIACAGKTTNNIHEVRIDSEAGKIITRCENVPHPDNPKTSYLAVLSAIATLKQILEPIKIGT